MDKFREGEDNPFDAPVAGQGLTDEPGSGHQMLHL
jgi:hypothetical protein